MTKDVDVFRSIIERDVGNIYDLIKQSLIKYIPSGLEPVVLKFIDNFEPKIIERLQAYVDLLIISSFLDDNTTLEEGTNNANKIINDTISNFLNEKIGIPKDAIKVALDNIITK